ncbi:MAG TPA: hypothetical protein DCS19_06355 [Flavobacterium sp.]|nr:hypothetical protein [Flavobacterium sp.]
MVTGVENKTYLLRNFANVKHTEEAMVRIIYENYMHVKSLSDSLYKGCTSNLQFYQNVWNFVRANVRYENDKPGIEQIRRPQRTITDGKGDCDCMSVLISSLLLCQGIASELNVVGYKKANEYSHVYVSAYTNQKERVCLDTVPEIPYFGFEELPIISHKILPIMKLEELGGLGTINVLDLIESELQQPLNGINDDYDEEDYWGQAVTQNFLLGKIEIVDNEEEAEGIFSTPEQLDNLKDLVVKNQIVEAYKALKTMVEADFTENYRKELQICANVLGAFPTERRDIELQIAVEQSPIYSNFYKTCIAALNETLQGEIAYRINNELNNIFTDAAKKLKAAAARIAAAAKATAAKAAAAVKNAANNVKNTVAPIVKNITKGVSNFTTKVWEGFKKYNPAFAGLRTLALAYISSNAGGIGRKLAIGYLTQAQAEKADLNIEDWKKAVQAKDQMEKKWKNYGGDPRNIKVAAFKRGGKGLSGELGIVPAVVAAASGVIAKLVPLIIKAVPFLIALIIKKKNGKEATDADVDAVAPPSNEDYVADQDGKTPDVRISEEEYNNLLKQSQMAENATTDPKEPVTETGFKKWWTENKKWALPLSIIIVVGIIAIVAWLMLRKKKAAPKRRGLSGLAKAPKRRTLHTQKATVRYLPAPAPKKRRKKTAKA